VCAQNMSLKRDKG